MGACSLWPDRLSRLMELSERFSGILPTACTASVWKTMPRPVTFSAICSMGKTTPVSLLAYMIVTMAVSSSRWCSSSSEVEPALPVHAQLDDAYSRGSPGHGRRPGPPGAPRGW